MDDLQVLICDDSALMRNLISRIVDSTEGMKVVGTAMNGRFCLQKIPTLNPDVIVLDIEMPEMNGIEFLKERKKQGIDIPVVVLSSVATRGAAVTMECLELGASDFITKPSGSISSNIASVGSDLIERLASYGRRYAMRHGKQVYPLEYYMQQAKLKEVAPVAGGSGTAGTAGTTSSAQKKNGLLNKIESKPVETKVAYTPSLFNQTKKDPAVITPLRKPGSIDVVALGISTGGPNALREVFAKLDPKLSRPILVVQHMPAGFTKEFAASLDRICPLNVKEAEDGDLIHPGQIYIAPGDYHIVVEKSTLCNVIRLTKDPQRNGHRPSADVLFESVAKLYQNRALGIIMTGMGKDGAAQLAELRKQGAWTLGQDEKSSIVYGMPRAAWELGAVQKQVALSDMAAEINNMVKEHAGR